MKIILSAVIFSHLVFAAGTFNINGKIRNFNQETVDISDGKKIYSISRKKLSESQNLMIKKTKENQEIFLTISFESLKNVKNVKK